MPYTAFEAARVEAAMSEFMASHMPKIRIHPESPPPPARKDYIRNWPVVH